MIRVVDTFGDILEVLYKEMCDKHGGGAAEALCADEGEGASYRTTPLAALPGTDLVGPFHHYLALLLEDQSPGRKKLYLLKSFPWKDDRGSIIIPPALVRIDLAISDEGHMGKRGKFQRRELEYHTPHYGSSQGLDLMESPLAFVPIALEMMARAHELASAYPRFVELDIRAAG